MAYAIGAELNQVFGKTDYKRGKIATPGTIVSTVGSDGATREYISVQLAGGQTLTNGLAFTIDGSGVATLGTANPSLLFGGRIGILQTASTAVQATVTTSGTSFAWCQIYGKAIAAVSASVTAIGGYLTMGTNGTLVGVIAANSASSVADGITAMATQAASGLLAVLLQYPKFQGYPA